MLYLRIELYERKEYIIIRKSEKKNNKFILKKGERGRWLTL